MIYSEDDLRRAVRDVLLSLAEMMEEYAADSGKDHAAVMGAAGFVRETANVPESLLKLARKRADKRVTIPVTAKKGTAP